MSDESLPELKSPVVRTFKDLKISSKKAMHGVEYKSKSFTLNTETLIIVKKLFWATQSRCNLYSLVIHSIDNGRIDPIGTSFIETEELINMEMVKRTIAWLRVK